MASGGDVFYYRKACSRLWDARKGLLIELPAALTESLVREWCEYHRVRFVDVDADRPAQRSEDAVRRKAGQGIR